MNVEEQSSVLFASFASSREKELAWSVVKVKSETGTLTPKRAIAQERVVCNGRAQARHAAIEAALPTGEVTTRSSSVKTGRRTRQCAPAQRTTKMTNTSVTQNDTKATPMTPTTGDTSPYAAAVATIQQELDTIAAAIPHDPADAWADAHVRPAASEH